MSKLFGRPFTFTESRDEEDQELSGPGEAHKIIKHPSPYIEGGGHMKKDQIATEIINIKRDISDIQTTLNQILTLMDNKPTLPEKRLTPNPMGKWNHFSHKLIGGFRDPAIREMVMTLRKQGMHFRDIKTAIEAAYPNNPEKHMSHSAIHRFYESSRKGRLMEFGIERTI
jgi:hypothetical protein